MCVVSMIYDYHYDKWWERYNIQPVTLPVLPFITPEEIVEFRKLLERAREYDKKNNQPDCELDEKKEKLKKLAKEMGVEISFL